MLFIEVAKSAKTDGFVRLVEVLKGHYRTSKKPFEENVEQIIELLDAMYVRYDLKRYGNLYRFTLLGLVDVEQAAQWAANKQYSIDQLVKDCAHCLLQHIRTKPTKGGSE